MSKTKQRLWTKFGGKEFFARMAENAKNDGEGNEISQTYATKDAATTSAAGLMSAADKTKLDNVASGAQVNTIESISANGTALEISGKNVDIPVATAQADGLLPHEKFPLIPPAPQGDSDQVYSHDGTDGTGWQPITKEQVGDILLDEQGKPVLDEASTQENPIPIYSEDSEELWTAYKGTGFGARRAYEDHTGANIRDSLDSKVDKVNGAAGQIPAFNAGGNLVDSGVPLEARQAADGGTDLSLVTTGEKYVWNNTRQLPDPTGHVNGSVLSLMSSTVQWDGESGDDFIEFTFPDGVTIPKNGGNTYSAIQIGNLIWMTSNMAYAPDGFTYSDSTGNSACYIKIDEYVGLTPGSHPEWGYAYNKAALQWFLNPNNNSWLELGWRIPTHADFVALYNFLVSDSASGNALKATTGWYTNGSDAYGFHADPSGGWGTHPYSSAVSVWRYTGSQNEGRAVYWCSDIYSGANYYAAEITNSSLKPFNPDSSVGTFACIRLVKDAPVEE